MSADRIRALHPLFHVGDGGSKPTSALQLHVERISAGDFIKFNRMWHSRLPECGNYDFSSHGAHFAATHEGIVYAVAFWSDPVARMLNGRGYYELRRMAIATGSPPNTASRMLAVMRRMIKKERPDVIAFISYQDLDVHAGTIYKADGWSVREGPQSSTARGFTGKGWTTRVGREMSEKQSPGKKVAWIKDAT